MKKNDCLSLDHGVRERSVLPFRPPDRLGRLGGAGLLEVGVSEEGP